MKEINCDVLVVGAGPAGSVTAWYAAKGGASVLLVEKRQEIGSPVRCGEGLSKYWLKDVGIPEDRRWIANEVDGARIFSPAGKAWIIDEKSAGNEVGYVIERDQFDKYLAQLAARAGAEIMLKTWVKGIIKKDGFVCGAVARHMGEDVRINAKIVVGADGYESQVGRWAGIDTSLKPNDIDTCIQYRMTGIECDRRFCDFYLGSVAPGGYIWVFPKNEDTANVGIGVQLSKIKNPGEVKQYLDRWIEKQPGIKKGKKIDMVAGAVSISQPLERTVDNGLMLVGDAARMIDPITGGGVSNGCKAGKVCGEVAAQAIEAKDCSAEFLQRYERGWRAILEEKQYRNWLAKEKLVTLSDDVFNEIIELLADTKLEKLNVYNLLKAVRAKFPDLVKEFEEML
jgi:digeranylgeranylglycerophospholipid reductase